METTKIPIGDKVVIVKWEDFDDDVIVDDILRIDYSNILGELITFPVIVNRLGILRAEADAIKSKKKFSAEVKKAELGEHYRKHGTVTTIDAGGTRKKKPPTRDQVDNMVVSDEEYKEVYEAYLSAERDFNLLDSLYWAAKSKDTKLKVFERDGFVIEDHIDELADGVINGIAMKIKRKRYTKKEA